MKVKSGFELRDVCGEKVVIAQGIENLDFSKLISLNESAAFLWEKAAALNTFTADDLVAALTAEYEVSNEQAAKDIATLLISWKEQGIVED